MNIYDTMNQLEREFRALPEYQAVVTALAAVKADEECFVCEIYRHPNQNANGATHRARTTKRSTSTFR